MAISCPSLWTDFCLETKGDIQITFQKCNRQDVQLARSASCPLDVLIDLTDVVDLVMATLAQSQCDIFRRAVCNLLKIADRCYNLELSGTLPPSWDAIPNSRPTFHSLEMLTVKHPSWLQKSFLSNTPVLCDVVLEGAPVDIPSLDLEHKSLTSVSLIQCSGGLLDVMRFLRPLSPRLRYLKVHSWAASTIGDDMEATGLLTPMSFPVPNQLIFETDESADASSSFMQQVLRHMSAPALTRRFLHKGLNNDQLPAIRHILRTSNICSTLQQLWIKDCVCGTELCSLLPELPRLQHLTIQFKSSTTTVCDPLIQSLASGERVSKIP